MSKFQDDNIARFCVKTGQHDVLFRLLWTPGRLDLALLNLVLVGTLSYLPARTTLFRRHRWLPEGVWAVHLLMGSPPRERPSLLPPHLADELTLLLLHAGLSGASARAAL